jgi:hypothetical protein
MQVSISSLVEFTDIYGRNNSASVFFHELAENYYRTHYMYDFGGNSSNGGFGAHSRAQRIEGSNFGNPCPGRAIFKPMNSGLEPIFPFIIDYLKTH